MGPEGPERIVPRRASGDDAAGVAEVWLRARHAAVPAIPRPVHPDEEVRRWFASVVLPSREVWVIERGEKIAALLVLDGSWVDQLYVDPSWTGKTLGSRLLVLAKDLHPDGLDLWTFQTNHGARRFYERHGFVAVAFTDGDNEEGVPDVHYRWPGG